MNEKDFKKGLASLKEVRMTDVEKARLLKNVLEKPVESPYMQVSRFSFPTFQLARMRVVTALSLILAVSFGGLVYASEEALPGEVLYSMKVGLVEPILDQLNSSVEKRVAWEEEKVARRIHEAEILIERDELDDARIEELERRVEKSSRAFAMALREQAKARSSGLTEAEKEMEEQVEKRKKEFREKFGFKPKVSPDSLKSAASSPDDSDEPNGSDDSDESKVSDDSDDSDETVESPEEDREEGIERLRRKAFEAIEEFGAREY